MRYENKIAFRASQMWILVKLLVGRIISLFYRDREPIWLIADRGIVAGDNGYRFFLYMKHIHSHVKTYFILSKSAPEWNLLENYNESRLEYRSLRHCIYLWRATYLVSTHIQGYFPFVGLGLWVKSISPFYRRKKHIFIQHGVSKDYSPFLEYANTGVDLVTCAVKPEYDFFIDTYHYPKNSVALTGMCRYDQLVDSSYNRRQILLVPTWREYIYKSKNFEMTDYYKCFSSLLMSERLSLLLEQNDWRLVFYPHHEMQRYLDAFINLHLSDRIHVAAESECDLSIHFKESNIMITDYSSVYFDFAYLQKPVLLYQFDREQFQSNHYNQGWLDYDHCFGPVCKTEAVLLDELEKLLKNGQHPDRVYEQYAANLFSFRDQQNSERTYRAIINRYE